MKGLAAYEARKEEEYIRDLEERELDEAHPVPKHKTVRFSGPGYTAFRRSVGEAYNETCQVCGKYAPILDTDGVFDVFTCGHVSHIKSRGAGGGDTMDNVSWECYECHIIKGHVRGER